MRNFWKKFRTLSKKCLILCSNIFCIICFKSTKKLFDMATLTFHVSDHIFFICYLKNHMTLFWGFWSKLFGNILKIFLIPGSKFFKPIFLESSVENFENGYFIFNQICPRFVSSLLFILWIILFWMKIRFARNKVKTS